MAFLMIFITQIKSHSQPDTLTFVEVVDDGDDNGIGGIIEMDTDDGDIPVISPNGAFLYQVAVDDDAINIFSINQSTGELTFVNVVKDNDPNGMGGSLMMDLDKGDRPVISPDGMFLYQISTADKTMNVFSINQMTGALTFVQVIEEDIMDCNGLELDFDTEGSFPVISSDGKFLFMSLGSENSVVSFSRDVTTGELTLVLILEDGESDGMGGTVDLSLDEFTMPILSQDGKYLYQIANDFLNVYSIDGTTGKLTLIQEIEDGVTPDGMGSTISIAHENSGMPVLSPDGKFLYHMASMDSVLNAFSINAMDGMLTLLQKIKDGDPDGMGGMISLSVDDDGARSCHKS